MMTGQTQRPIGRNMTAREVDESYEGAIPDTPYADLPSNFNEFSERKRIEEWLFIERLDNDLSYFYEEMNV